ncbi:hypothetical protein P7K49_036491 [Saguinus oedipus]|uniref:Uncharacterized protein n=1 Tax=Saguinus oedipus TaxID=9490 RepID=A0ABQ9TKI9_SAGOE|nr:hypothetical protein P7K49_036491 [Saguinus oedipus]
MGITTSNSDISCLLLGLTIQNSFQHTSHQIRDPGSGVEKKDKDLWSPCGPFIRLTDGLTQESRVKVLSESVDAEMSWADLTSMKNLLLSSWEYAQLHWGQPQLLEAAPQNSHPSGLPMSSD